MQLLMLPGELSKKYTKWAVKLVDALREANNVIIVTHRNPDPDAIGAAAVTSTIVKNYSGNHCLVFPEGLSRASKQVLSHTGWSPPRCPVGFEPDLVVIVDSSNPTQLGEYEWVVENRRVVVIDHHQPGILHKIAYHAIHDPNAGSASEIAVLLAYTLSILLPSDVATLALSGIYYDTKKFSIASLTTFAAATVLLSMGARIPEHMFKQQAVADFSERYARIKAASRGKVGRSCKDIIVVVSHVGSFESSAARGLIDLGADVVVILSDRGREYRASIRVSRRALERGISASKIAEYLATKYGGQGGGHHAAALAHLQPFAPSVEEAVDDIARRLPGKVSRFCV